MENAIGVLLIIALFVLMVICLPCAVKTQAENRGLEARQAFSHLASSLSFGLGYQKSKVIVDIYGRLNDAI